MTGKTAKNDKAGESVARFADIEVLRYHVDCFENLPLKQKKFIYYLNEAALCGRDIIFDQNGRYNLRFRRLFGTILKEYPGDRSVEEFLAIREYTYGLWFASGIHHHYSSDKFIPQFSKPYFKKVVERMRNEGFLYLFGEKELALLTSIVFEPDLFPKKTDQSDSVNAIEKSSVNFYDEKISQEEVEHFYNHQKTLAASEDRKHPVSYGLNSRLARNKEGKIYEQRYSVQGLYAPAIRHIVDNLTKAAEYAGTNTQKNALEALIRFYKTGDLKEYNTYCIEWVKDTESRVDFINGFTETYSDPLGMKGSWEGLVHFKDMESSVRTKTLSNHAKWFEDNAPIDPLFKKKNPVGISASVVTVAMLAGDSYPATPIGINLPNADWIRARYGSKSVTIENIHYAYDVAKRANGMDRLFVPDEESRLLLEKYGDITDRLHTDLHECLGHGSGRLLEGTNPDALGVCASTIEEARADLFALYFMADKKMIQLGLLPDQEAYKACYYRYFLNGLITQLVRIKLGDNLEEAHMKNRALIANYVLEKAEKKNLMQLNGIELIINDYEKIRPIIGELLAEVQRIKSEGDLPAAMHLIEKYGTKIDKKIHKKVLDLYRTLNIAPYKGFVNPLYTLAKNQEGEIADVLVCYEESYEEQMQRYDAGYGFLSLDPVSVYEILQDSFNPSESIMAQANALRKKLRLAMDGIVSTTMRKKGLDYKYNFGLTREHLLRLAKETPSSIELARYLWNTEVRELRIIATMIMPPEELGYSEALSMAIAASYHTELREQLCMNLLSKCSDAAYWAISWLMDKKNDGHEQSNPSELKLTALMLLARIAFNGSLHISNEILQKLLLETKQILIPAESQDTIEQDNLPSLHQQMAVVLLKRIGEMNRDNSKRVRIIIESLKDSSSDLYKEFYHDIIFHLDYVQVD